MSQLHRIINFLFDFFLLIVDLLWGVLRPLVTFTINLFLPSLDSAVNFFPAFLTSELLQSMIGGLLVFGIMGLCYLVLKIQKPLGFVKKFKNWQPSLNINLTFLVVFLVIHIGTTSDLYKMQNACPDEGNNQTQIIVKSKDSNSEPPQTTNSTQNTRPVSSTVSSASVTKSEDSESKRNKSIDSYLTFCVFFAFYVLIHIICSYMCKKTIAYETEDNVSTFVKFSLLLTTFIELTVIIASYLILYNKDNIEILSKIGFGVYQFCSVCALPLIVGFIAWLTYLANRKSIDRPYFSVFFTDDSLSLDPEVDKERSKRSSKEEQKSTENKGKIVEVVPWFAGEHPIADANYEEFTVSICIENTPPPGSKFHKGAPGSNVIVFFFMPPNIVPFRAYRRDSVAESRQIWESCEYGLFNDRHYVAVPAAYNVSPPAITMLSKGEAVVVEITSRIEKPLSKDYCKNLQNIGIQITSNEGITSDVKWLYLKFCNMQKTDPKTTEENANASETTHSPLLESPNENSKGDWDSSCDRLFGSLTETVCVSEAQVQTNNKSGTNSTDRPLHYREGIVWKKAVNYLLNKPSAQKNSLFSMLANYLLEHYATMPGHKKFNSDKKGWDDIENDNHRYDVLSKLLSSIWYLMDKEFLPPSPNYLRLKQTFFDSPPISTNKYCPPFELSGDLGNDLKNYEKEMEDYFRYRTYDVEGMNQAIHTFYTNYVRERYLYFKNDKDNAPLSNLTNVKKNCDDLLRNIIYKRSEVLNALEICKRSKVLEALDSSTLNKKRYLDKVKECAQKTKELDEAEKTKDSEKTKKIEALRKVLRERENLKPSIEDFLEDFVSVHCGQLLELCRNKSNGRSAPQRVFPLANILPVDCSIGVLELGCHRGDVGLALLNLDQILTKPERYFTEQFQNFVGDERDLRWVCNPIQKYFGVTDATAVDDDWNSAQWGTHMELRKKLQQFHYDFKSGGNDRFRKVKADLCDFDSYVSEAVEFFKDMDSLVVLTSYALCFIPMDKRRRLAQGIRAIQKHYKAAKPDGEFFWFNQGRSVDEIFDEESSNKIATRFFLGEMRFKGAFLFGADLLPLANDLHSGWRAPQISILCESRNEDECKKFINTRRKADDVTYQKFGRYTPSLWGEGLYCLDEKSYDDLVNNEPALSQELSIYSNIVFPMLDSPNVKAGEVQRLLESQKMSYIGSTAETVETLADIDKCRKIWLKAKDLNGEEDPVPVLDWIVYDPLAKDHPDLEDMFRSLGKKLRLEPGESVRIVSAFSGVDRKREVNECSISESDSDFEEFKKKIDKAKKDSKGGKLIIEPKRTFKVDDKKEYEHIIYVPIIESGPKAIALPAYMDEKLITEGTGKFSFTKSSSSLGRIKTINMAKRLALNAYRAVDCHELGVVEVVYSERYGLQVSRIQPLPYFWEYSGPIGAQKDTDKSENSESCAANGKKSGNSESCAANGKESEGKKQELVIKPVVYYKDLESCANEAKAKRFCEGFGLSEEALPNGFYYAWKQMYQTRDLGELKRDSEETHASGESQDDAQATPASEESQATPEAGEAVEASPKTKKKGAKNLSQAKSKNSKAASDANRKSPKTVPKKTEEGRKPIDVLLNILCNMAQRNDGVKKRLMHVLWYDKEEK